MAGYKVDELYREVGKYKARIDVYITAQGYEATAVFLDNLNTKPLVKFVDRSKERAIALSLEQLARIFNRMQVL
ncbi:hypothetical protein [Parageobacillus thermoglucosidasius]|jgi:hypothetical protein|uniref:Uncharacterized protein n=1 Tax=Parageobacillus thermoglucosidasius TaxID=1426 RepID=A0AB38R5P8_PARTM|nr:hypothetical protein [Parageobacillus thermoglucosidasius]UOE78287.1 hypothetical protein IMI45_19865 [Parageobacillus thermoglucosidasius]